MIQTIINKIAIALFCLLAGGATALAKDDLRVTDERRVGDFTSIEIKSVATIYFTQGEKCSLTIEGTEENVRRNTTTVKNGRLTIDARKQGNLVNRGEKTEGVIIRLTAPTVEKISFTGVGEFICEERLTVNDLVMSLSGVGDFKVKELVCHSLDIGISGIGEAVIQVECEELKARVSGIGSLTLKGSATTADVKKTGLGSLSTRGLKIGEKMSDTPVSEP